VILSFLAALALQAAPAPAFPPRSLVHDGHRRTWQEIAPAACLGRRARCPVLVALHGGGGLVRGTLFVAATGLASEGAARGYVVLAPDALGDNWNDGRPEIAVGIDDVGFIRAMIADAGTRFGIDRRRIFAVGASNGGLMSFRLACEAGSLFRAIAPVIANMSEPLISRCRPTASVSVLMMPGTVDPLMRYEGGAVAVGLRNRGRTVSADRTLEFWRAAMACPVPPRTERFDPVRDETAVAITRYDSCRGGATVRRWTVEGGGHTWPGRGGGRRAYARLVGPTATEFSATRVVLDFFDAVGAAR
jgi:polyhydroxybutyrate depolymerase